MSKSRKCEDEQTAWRMARLKDDDLPYFLKGTRHRFASHRRVGMIINNNDNDKKVVEERKEGKGKER